MHLNTLQSYVIAEKTGLHYSVSRWICFPSGVKLFFQSSCLVSGLYMNIVQRAAFVKYVLFKKNKKQRWTLLTFYGTLHDFCMDQCGCCYGYRRIYYYWSQSVWACETVLCTNTLTCSRTKTRIEAGEHDLIMSVRLLLLNTALINVASHVIHRFISSPIILSIFMDSITMEVNYVHLLHFWAWDMFCSSHLNPAPQHSYCCLPYLQLCASACILVTSPLNIYSGTDMKGLEKPKLNSE